MLGSFIMCSCLLIMYSSRYFPLLSVVVSCHDVDVALQSIAMIASSFSHVVGSCQLWSDRVLEVFVCRSTCWPL